MIVLIPQITKNVKASIPPDYHAFRKICLQLD